MNVVEMNPKENQEDNNNSDLLKSTSKCDFRDLNKIGIEIIGIGGSNVDGVDLKCRIKKKLYTFKDSKNIR